MKHQFGPALLWALTLTACGSQSGVIGERQPGIDNQSVGDGHPDAAAQTEPPEFIESDAGGAPHSEEPALGPPSATTTSSSAGPSSTETPAPGATQSSAAAADAGAPEPEPSDEPSTPPMPCSDTTKIDAPAMAIAARLATLILQAQPDEELLAAAADGHLGTYGEVECQARRLTELPEASAGVTGLLESWLALEDLPDAAHGDVSGAVWSQMKTEASDYLARVANAEPSDLAALLQGNDGLVGPELAAHYGVELPEGETSALVEIPGRAGVLSLGRVTAALGRIGQRGYWVVKRFECLDLGAPSESDFVAPPAAGTTYREAYESAVSTATCNGCHTFIDGPGFALENFSLDGRYVVQETGHPIDASGYLPERDESGMSFANVELDGAAELASALLESPTVRSCLASRVFDYAVPQEDAAEKILPSEGDLRRVRQVFEAVDLDFRQLLVAVTQTELFWHELP